MKNIEVTTYKQNYYINREYLSSEWIVQYENLKTIPLLKKVNSKLVIDIEVEELEKKWYTITFKL